MIDWVNLAANSLWVLALSLALSVLSVARWAAIRQEVKLGEVLKTKCWQTSFNIAGILFCGGLAATTAVLWERVLWLILLFIFGIQIGLEMVSARKEVSG